MPSKLSGETIAKLQKIGAKVSFRSSAEVYEENEVTGKPRKVRDAIIHADLYDIAAGEIYAIGTHPHSEELAALDAIEKAMTKDKPLTPAQKADPRFMKGLAAAKEAEQLRAELEALKAAQVEDTQRKIKPRGTTAD